MAINQPPVLGAEDAANVAEAGAHGTFQMTLPWIPDQQLGARRAMIAMHAKDWKPTASVAK